MSNDDLLRPTLTEYRQAPALYDSTGFVLSAFFGGPVGAALYALANITRLSRLSRTTPVVITYGAVALRAGVCWFAGRPSRGTGRFVGMTTATHLRAPLRALGLGCFGAIYFVHRRFFRSARVSGVRGAAELSPVPALPRWCSGLGGKCTLCCRILKHH